MSLPHGTEEGQWYTEKILPRHWERLAVVCVRQSTMISAGPAPAPRGATSFSGGSRKGAWIMLS